MRKTFGLLCAAALMLPVGVIAAQSAGAVAGAVPTCTTAKGTFKFTPPLPLKGTITGGKLTSTGTISGCKGGGVVSGKTSYTSTKLAKPTKSGCSTLLKPDPKSKGTLGSFTVKWNNGKTSTAKSFYIRQDPKTLVNATTTGKITSGAFVGKTIKGTVTFTLNSGACSKKAATGGTYVQKKGTKFTIS